jgi:integrase
MKINLPYLCMDYDRHGNRRLYVRRDGRKIRIRAKVGDTEFRSAYDEAITALDAPAPRVRLNRVGSFGWLAERYFDAPEFKALDPVSQVRRRAIIEGCLREPRKPGSTDLMKDCPVAALTPQHVIMLRDRKAKEGKPAAANNRRKWLSALFGWAIEHGHMKSNPARDARRVRYASEGWHTWTVEEVRQYEARHPIGTKPRLALALLLWLGVRRGDVVILGRQHAKDGWIRFVPRKTRHRRQRMSEKPIPPELQQVIDASPCGDLTFLVTEFGKPFTAAGFGNWFRDRCNEAGLPHCSAHGLRKAGATIAAENGATDRELMALYDWDSAAMATIYTRQASQKKLAGQAARKLRSVTRL